MPPVIPMLVYNPDSHRTTGTATVRNFVPTDVGVTVDEITTTALPVASAVVAVEPALTVTTYPNASSRAFIAASLVLSVVEAVTRSAGDATLIDIHEEFMVTP